MEARADAGIVCIKKTTIPYQACPYPLVIEAGSFPYCHVNYTRWEGLEEDAMCYLQGNPKHPNFYAVSYYFVCHDGWDFDSLCGYRVANDSVDAQRYQL